MNLYAGFPIHSRGGLISCPECGRDTAWLPVLDLEDEEVTVACGRSNCQATVRRPMEYGEKFSNPPLSGPTEIHVRIHR
jgi:hypothetical protein